MSGFGGDDEDLEPKGPAKRGRKKGGHDEPPEESGDDAELDRQLAGEMLNDFGNAQRLKARFGDDLIFVENNGWFAWDGARWSRDRGHDEAFKRAHLTALKVWDERRALEKAPGKKSPEALETWLKRMAQHANHSGNTSAVTAMLTACAPYLSKPIEALDADPLLAACENGTIELSKECTFRESRRSDLLTRRLGVAFREGGRCPRFLMFLQQILPDDEMRDFLQRILGYCLSGSTREQVLFMFYGSGNNGKSTLMNVIRHIMGDYALGAPVQMILAKREGGSGADASPDLARLPGARLVIMAEPQEGAKLDEGRVKEVTGGETIVARHLNQGFFEYRPVFKPVILLNHLPVIRGVDQGIWRRIRLMPFTVQIPEDQIDRDLEGKLIEEAPAILQWMLRGYEAYRMVGLAPPDAAIAVVAEYRADQDLVGEFLAECCVLTENPDPATGEPYEVGAKQLRTLYKEWCEQNGLDAIGSKTFGSKLTGRGLKKRKTMGVMVYLGIVIKAGKIA